MVKRATSYHTTFQSNDPQYMNYVVKFHTPAHLTVSCEYYVITKLDFEAKLMCAGERAIDHLFPIQTLE